MPIYEYVCEKCGKLNEVLQKVNDPAPEKCDGCGETGKMSRIVSRTSFQLKGGGWYSDLYSSAKKGDTKTETAKPTTLSSSEKSSTPAASSTSTTGSGSGSNSGGGTSKAAASQA